MSGARVLDELSPRERDVLVALTERRSNAEIAARFVLSVRTVESHVASLLRKTGAADRHELAALGASMLPGGADGRALVPDPPSTLIGRVAEQAALAEALRQNRLVTALGPGGVGKTRIALAVARDGLGLPDGTVYVDLVPVMSARGIAAAIAAAAGVGAQQAASSEDALAAWLQDRRLLLVLDNCEHLLDAVAPLLERLLARNAGLTVLATSRVRLLVPYERVFPVPGLSVDRETGAGDAVALFRARAEAQGAVLDAGDDRRIAAICTRLDGMALAIELAAARVPSLGLGGLEEGLPAALDLLAGGGRTDERHRSLRATLDWSVSLLAADDRVVLATTAVFAAPFTPAAAAALLERPIGPVQAALARLADSSLLAATSGRFRMLETVRQYGAERLGADGGLDAVLARHLAWCTRAADEDFDRIAPELRAALVWATPLPAHRQGAFLAANRLAEQAFAAGVPAEAQSASERAASLAPDDAAAVAALRDAAGAAEARNVGLDALRLHRAAAERAEAMGDRDTAAIELLRIAVLVVRAPGLMAVTVPIERGEEALEEARRLATGDPTTAAHLLTVDSMYLDPSWGGTDSLADEAVLAAAAVGDRVLENVALDIITSARLVGHDIGAALDASLRRIALLDDVPMAADVGMEFADAYSMTGECAMAAGDLPLAQRFGERVRTLPAYAREPHLAVGRSMTFAFLVGEWRQVTALAPAFLDGWTRAGRPRAGNLTIGSQAAASAYAMQGDDASAARWRELVGRIRSPGLGVKDYLALSYMYALVAVHRGAWDEALALLQTAPDGVRTWQNGMWRPWYASLWAEAAVLAGAPDAASRITAARPHVAENPIAEALLERAAILRTSDGDLAAVAARLDGLGARYQAARSRVLQGGADAELGRAQLTDLGTAPLR
ncbi:LuxR C-terminal-related transcriptional regulator [uncultured Amnibacterium sp.]|uniref:ATP-binding protein n=1 Tax=uncultured Amnibacterium sp. TaxID=1631851 RepID=UPI0035CC1044